MGAGIFGGGSGVDGGRKFFGNILRGRGEINDPCNRGGGSCKL